MDDYDKYADKVVQDIADKMYNDTKATKKFNIKKTLNNNDTTICIALVFFSLFMLIGILDGSKLLQFLK